MSEPGVRAAKPIPAWLPPVGAALLRTWGATWRLRERFPPEVDPHRSQRATRCVYVFWHGAILIACHVYRNLGICVAQSHHRDGEIAARVTSRLGYVNVRGSSSRGAAQLLRAMLDWAGRAPGDIAFTPDGPKGPSRQTKPGALFLAAQLDWPLVPVAMTARPRKEFASWDHFMLPWPFASVGIVAAEPLRIERGASTERLAELCREVDRRLNDAERAAEELIA